MPIRINLLAETQAAEELRRKDPVKRSLIVAVILVAAVLVWSGTLQLRILSARSQLSGFDAKWKTIESSYQGVVEQKRKVLEAEEKLSALQRYTTNRFLWGTVLNAFQQTMLSVDDIQVVRFKADQSYTIADEVKPRPNEPKGRPATSTQKVLLKIEAIDSSAQRHVDRFKRAIASTTYFQQHLQKTNAMLLTSLSAPQFGPASRTPYVMFTLECYFPDKVR